jgi:hypothetical protein
VGELVALEPVVGKLDDEFGEGATLLEVRGAGESALDRVDGVRTVLALSCLPDEQPANRPSSATPTSERFTNTARSLPADARQLGSTRLMIDIGSGTL